MPRLSDSTKLLFRCTISLSIAVGGVRRISTRGDIVDRGADGALLLLFPPGKRPDLRALRAAVGQAARTRITHEIDGGETVELLRDGLTYDLTGLAPHPAAAFAPPRHGFGVEREGTFEAMVICPGAHIAAGAHTMPVVRTLAGIAAELAPNLPGLAAMGWPPASSAIEPGFFASTVGKWLEGGAFPALGLTAFTIDSAGSLRSEGLAWFTGQEIALDAALAEDRAAATRLAIRLVNQLVGRGPLATAEAILGPDGEQLLLEPVESGAVVRVRRG